MYRKNAWAKYKDNMKEVMDFAEQYKKYISLVSKSRLR